MNSSDVSVTISLYNKEHTIKRAVYSILNQELQPKSIIIVNDGSTDSGPEISKKLSLEYPSVKYIHQYNQGVSAARNKGIEEADTEFVCLLDADDVWEPNYMTNLLKLHERVGDADLYCLAYQMHSEYGMLKPKVALPKNYIGVVENFISTYSKGYGVIHTSAVCFRKKFIQRIGGFPEGEIFGEDLYLWLKAGLEGKIAFIDEISVTLYKEPVNSIKWREHHPFYVSYFVNSMNDYTKKEQKALKKFLVKNIYLQWAAAKIEKNRKQKLTLRRYCFQLSKTSGFILLISELLPTKVFEYLKNRRTKQRIL